MIDGLSEVFESITRHRLRALATAFGVFWGIFMLTVLLAGGQGLRNGIDVIFADNAVSSVWMYGYRTLRTYQGLGAGRTIELTIDDLDALARAVPELENLTPRRTLPPGITVSHGVRTAALPLIGIYPSYHVVEKTKLLRGRLINGLDVARARKVAVIGETARKILFGLSDPVGQTIGVGGVEFDVVGEFTDAGGEEEIRRVYLPYSALTRTFDGSRKIDFLVAMLRGDAPVLPTRARIMRVLATRHRFDPHDEGAAQAWFMVEEFRKLQAVINGIDAGIWVVGLGTLLSGMVGVSNILFVSVRERSREFGVRRALGASARSVLWLVITEALCLASIAGGLGLAAALGAIRLAHDAAPSSGYFKDPSVDLQTALGSLAVLIVTALIAGFFPAREAARMHPIEALRQE